MHASFVFLVTMKSLKVHSVQGSSYKEFVIYFPFIVIHTTITPAGSPYQSLCIGEPCSQNADVCKVLVLCHFCYGQMMMPNDCFPLVLFYWTEFAFPHTERRWIDSPETCFLWTCGLVAFTLLKLVDWKSLLFSYELHRNSSTSLQYAEPDPVCTVWGYFKR